MKANRGEWREKTRMKVLQCVNKDRDKKTWSTNTVGLVTSPQMTAWLLDSHSSFNFESLSGATVLLVIRSGLRG